MNDQEQSWHVSSAGDSDAEGLRFESDEWQALVALRAAWERGGDLLSEREQARLRFVRWLIETGRLEP